MSDHQQFMKEREQIDFYIQKGYKMTNFIENLSGAIVEFSKKKDANGEKTTQSLHILTANGRKYFSSKFIQQANTQT